MEVFKRVKNITLKKETPLGVALRDKGRLETRESEDRVANIENHIRSFPRYKSHYSKAKFVKNFLILIYT